MFGKQMQRRLDGEVKTQSVESLSTAWNLKLKHVKVMMSIWSSKVVHRPPPSELSKGHVENANSQVLLTQLLLPGLPNQNLTHLWLGISVLQWFAIILTTLYIPLIIDLGNFSKRIARSTVL